MSGRFTHQMLPYRGIDEFLSGTIPFVTEGVVAGDAVLAVSSERNLELLRQALGDDAYDAEFVVATEWFRHPARTLATCLAQAQELAGEGRRLRLVGEPVWAGRPRLEVLEWQRVEALVNVAFTGTGASIMCPYDLQALPQPILDGARRTHPEAVDGPRPSTNPRYMNPWDYSSRFDAPPLPPPPETAEALPIDMPDLFWLRAYVADYARRTEMAETELQRLLVAVTEVVTNALRHGAPPIVLRLWTEPAETFPESHPGPMAHELVCEVTDAGTWPTSVDLGFIPPASGRPCRLGLWAVRLLCSVVQVRTGGSGTTVRLRLPTAVRSAIPATVGSATRKARP